MAVVNGKERGGLNFYRGNIVISLLTTKFSAHFLSFSVELITPVLCKILFISITFLFFIV